MSDDSSGGTYTISDAQIDFAGVFAYASTIPGTIVCGLVLIAYAVVASFEAPRKCLDRVSFRLLAYSLVFNVLFGISYAATPTSPSVGCSVGAFFVNFTLSFATFFTTCIAINLQLVLMHGINGKVMEKYYVIGTVILSLALNLPTAALGEFGWNEQSATCWYSNADDKIRLRWIIGTQSFWILLAAGIETVCSIVVLLWLYRFQMTINLFTRAAASQSVSGTKPDEKSVENTKKTKSLFTNSTRTSVFSQDPRFQKVILRIVLYPIISLLMNITTVALDINLSIHSVNTQFDFRLLVLDLVMYGVRPLAYGLLSAGDPSFINAVKVLRGRNKQQSVGPHSRTLTNLDFIPGQGSASQSHATTHGEESKPGIAVDLEGQQASLPEDKLTHDHDEEKSRREADQDEIRDLERQL